MSLTILLLQLILSPAASATSINDVCPPITKIQKMVFNCGENVVAAKIAQACADFVFARWRETVPTFEATIKNSLAAMSKDQQGELRHSELEYQMNAELLDMKVAFFATYADLLASYPQMMMDSLGGRSDATSAPCFNSAFHGVENTVSELDSEIVRTMHAKDSLFALSSELGNKVVAVNSLSASAAGSSVISKSFKKGSSVNPQSDITGNTNERQLASGWPGGGIADKIGQQATQSGASAVSGGQAPSLVGDSSLSPAIRQVARAKEIGSMAGAWAGTKIGQEILHELANPEEGEPAAKKASAVLTGEGIEPHADGARSENSAIGSAGGTNSIGEGISGHPDLSSDAKLAASETSIFISVSRKYRLLEAGMKKK